MSFLHEAVPRAMSAGARVRIGLKEPPAFSQFFGHVFSEVSVIENPHQLAAQLQTLQVLIRTLEACSRVPPFGINHCCAVSVVSARCRWISPSSAFDQAK